MGEQVTFDEMIMISALYWTNALSWIFKMLAHWNSLCSYSLVTCAQKQHMPITQCLVWPDKIRTSIYRRFLIIRYNVVDIVRCMGGLNWWLISSILLCLKSDSTHHFIRNACAKSGSLRFSQFSGCWLILSVYILLSFDFPYVRLFGVR